MYIFITNRNKGITKLYIDLILYLIVLLYDNGDLQRCNFEGNAEMGLWNTYIVLGSMCAVACYSSSWATFNQWDISVSIALHLSAIVEKITTSNLDVFSDFLL